VEIVRVVVDGVKLLLLGMGSDWDGSTSGKTCSGTSDESGSGVRGAFGGYLGSGFFSSSRGRFVRAGLRRSGRG